VAEHLRKRFTGEGRLGEKDTRESGEMKRPPPCAPFIPGCNASQCRGGAWRSWVGLARTTVKIKEGQRERAAQQVQLLPGGGGGWRLAINEGE